MLTNSKALYKLLTINHEFVRFDGGSIHVIPEGRFTPEEIEELRDIQEYDLKCGNDYFIANFLPDDLRPAHVKKL